MASDEEDDEKPRKRQRVLHDSRATVLHALSNSRATIKQLEELLKVVRGWDRTRELFSIPAHEVKEEDFRQRYGMIDLDHRMPSYDRFRLVETPDETLRCISGLVAKDVLYSTAFSGDGGELQDAPILDRFFRALGRFTRPRTEEPVFPQDTTDHADEEVLKKADLAVEYISTVDPELNEADGLPLSSDDQDDLPVQPQASSAAAPRQWSDVKLSVYSERNTIRGLRLRVIDDFKTVPSVRNLFQAAVYGVQSLEETADHPKEYRPPLYLLAQNKHTWYYGILEIDGYIRVKNGEIDPVILQAFPEQHQPVNTKKFTASLSRGVVVEKFEAWKRKMADKGMHVPDGLHPVGRFFYRPFQSHEVPSLSAHQSLMPGQKKLYDGLLKILVGRRVTRWSVEDAIAAWDARKYLEEEALKTAGCPERYLPRLLAM